jgi:hypothetical protein
VCGRVGLTVGTESAAILARVEPRPRRPTHTRTHQVTNAGEGVTSREPGHPAREARAEVNKHARGRAQLVPIDYRRPSAPVHIREREHAHSSVIRTDMTNLCTAMMPDITTG